MIDQEISDFIKSQTVATIACVEDGKPYCFNCYYAFIEESGLLIYKSSYNTRHEKIMEKNKLISGTIIPEQIEVSVIKGIQLEGLLLNDSLDLTMKASAAYYLKFPFAMAIPGKLYTIELQTLKYTDNTKGFGYKQQWQKKN